jgi:hypothetical protein
VVGTGSGYFSMTFRIWLALNESGNARRIAGAEGGAAAGCGCKSGAADSCGCGGSCGAPTPATDFESHRRAFHARHAVHLDAPPPPSGASRIAAKTMMRMGTLGATMGAGGPPRPGAPPAGGGTGHGTHPPPCPTGTGINPAYTQCLETNGTDAACAGVPEFITFPACAYETEANGPGPLQYYEGLYELNGMCRCSYSGGCEFWIPAVMPTTGEASDCVNCPPQLYESECEAIAGDISNDETCSAFLDRCNVNCSGRNATDPQNTAAYRGCCKNWCMKQTIRCYGKEPCCNPFGCGTFYQGPTQRPTRY